MVSTPGFWKPHLLANGAHDWLSYSNIIDICRSKILKFWVLERRVRRIRSLFTKALTLLMEQGFNRELRQYGRNPVVQCWCFAILKPAHYCRSNYDTICSCSFNFNITFLNATCTKDKIINHGTKFTLLHGKIFIWLVTWHAFGFHRVGILTFH